jgi:prolyl-tRNA synthetase
MRMSQLFGKRQREIPAEADTASHRLLIKAGMINQLAAGVYSYLPLAWRTLRKIEAVVREEMEQAGGQEVMLPALHPIELWQKSGRDTAFGQNLFRLTDRKQRELVLGPTHEEVMADLASKHIQSYRDLPVRLYQIQTKFRDEPRPRGGLIRVREFDMKDLYSFDADEAGLDVSYNKMVQAYKSIYARCGLTTILIEADSGAIGGKDSQEFMALTEIGEDEIIICDTCICAANVEKAVCIKEHGVSQPEAPLKEVATPDQRSIEAVAAFLKVPATQTIKAVFYIADGEFLMVVIRGDLEVNEVKLKKVLHAAELRLAIDAEVKKAGIVAGFASPVGLNGVKIVADDSVNMASNFVAGANKEGYHLKNVNFPRDFKADVLADVARARAGDRCLKCGAVLRTVRGMEVGHVFKLGTSIAEKMGAFFTDQDGSSRPVIMGSYGIGIGRLMSAVIELNHDDKGIVWPKTIAPFRVYLCPLYKGDKEVIDLAEKLYKELNAQGIETLLDDRAEESAGVKFNDADLLGIPVRLTVSSRSLQKGGVELKQRNADTLEMIEVNRVVERVKQIYRD